MSKQVAIVDYGLGNLFSVKHACEHARLDAVITSDARQIKEAGAVVLPGVGAFGEAMRSLQRLGLVDVLRDTASSGKIMMGICLGMQLLMEESHEFGRHEGLGIVRGKVLPLEQEIFNGSSLKIPHIGWTSIRRPVSGWDDSLLEGLEPGVGMYFVHSFYCRLADPSQGLAMTEFGTQTFCSGVRSGNVEAFQFHPERSGRHGLRVYENFAKKIEQHQGESNARAKD